MFESTSLNQFHKDTDSSKIDKVKIKVTNLVGVCISNTELSNKAVLLTAVIKGQIDGDTLFKLDIFSLVWVFIITLLFTKF